MSSISLEEIWTIQHLSKIQKNTYLSEKKVVVTVILIAMTDLVLYNPSEKKTGCYSKKQEKSNVSRHKEL